MGFYYVLALKSPICVYAYIPTAVIMRIVKSILKKKKIKIDVPTFCCYCNWLIILQRLEYGLIGNVRE